MKRENQILVAGIGNTIRGDDGVGIHLARRLKEILPPRFEIRELTTAGLSLLETISGYGKVILIDAIQTPKGKPGQVYHLSLQDFKHSSNLSSTHGLDLKQVVELKNKLMGGKIPQVEVLAVEARKLDEFSEKLSPELEKEFDGIVEKVRTEIEMEN
jgi:hydrogenase maturation protease